MNNNQYKERMFNIIKKIERDIINSSQESEEGKSKSVNVKDVLYCPKNK